MSSLVLQVLLVYFTSLGTSTTISTNQLQMNTSFDQQTNNQDQCKSTLQGCECVDAWGYEQVFYTGCANPDNDTRGSWCIVDSSCAATDSIGMAVLPNGTIVSYDYCPVNCGKTTLTLSQLDCNISIKQCKCSEQWFYRDQSGIVGCANPDEDPLGPWCIVDPESCPPNTQIGTAIAEDEELFFDYCPNICTEMTNSQEDQVMDEENETGDQTSQFTVQLNEGEQSFVIPSNEETSLALLTDQQNPDCTTTIKQCKCAEQWFYRELDNLTNCENPDQDPQGPWCIVEPISCPPDTEIGTAIAADGLQFYDYCPDVCAEDGTRRSLNDTSNQASEFNNQDLSLPIVEERQLLPIPSVVEQGTISLQEVQQAPVFEVNSRRTSQDILQDSLEEYLQVGQVDNIEIDFTSAPIAEQLASLSPIEEIFLDPSFFVIDTLPLPEPSQEAILEDNLDDPNLVEELDQSEIISPSALSHQQTGLAPLLETTTIPSIEEAQIDEVMLLENLEEMLQAPFEVPSPESLSSQNLQGPIAERVLDNEEDLVEQFSSSYLNEYEIMHTEFLHSKVLPVLPVIEQLEVPSEELSPFEILDELLPTPASDFDQLYQQKLIDNFGIAYVQKLIVTNISNNVEAIESPTNEIQQGFGNEINLLQNLDEYFESGVQTLPTNQTQAYPIIQLENRGEKIYEMPAVLDDFSIVFTYQQLENVTIEAEFLDKDITPTIETQSLEQDSAPTVEPVLEDPLQSLEELQYGEETQYFKDLEYGAVSLGIQLSQRYFNNGEPVNLLEQDSICWRSKARCSCLPEWSYDANNDGIESLFRGCIQTADARGRAWCAVDIDSCRNPPASESAEQSRYNGAWDFCPKPCTLARRSNCTTTVNDCRCGVRWQYEGLNQQGCTKPDGTSTYSWCLVRAGCKTPTGYLSSTNNAKWDICSDECAE